MMNFSRKRILSLASLKTFSSLLLLNGLSLILPLYRFGLQAAGLALVWVPAPALGILEVNDECCLFWDLAACKSALLHEALCRSAQLVV